MPLEEYKRKRDFRKTPEPAGTGVATSIARGGRFVVQRHRATRLHYDFRLEIDGVLVSWAVPKGPTLDAGQRRMAVHVEDHPIEYLDFEGVIPRGEYGGGDVIVWDWGTWLPEAETPDGRRAVEDGELKFTLSGEKLRGRFTIVRTSGRGSGRGARERRESSRLPFQEDGGDQWLLIHKRDDASVPGWDAEDHPQSVKTGRTNDEVKADRDAIWLSHAPPAVAEIDLSAAREAKLPGFIPPMAATLTDRGFRDDDWLFEIKWDGYRIEAVVKDGTARIYTRNGNDGETYFPKLLTKATWIEAQEAIVDGEVVAIGEDGLPDFSLLQEATGGASTRFVYQAFDLLHLDGRSLLNVPLESRKQLLRSVLRAADTRVRFADHVVGEGLVFLEAARQQKLEGVVAKHRRSIYEPGRRARTWLKIKVRPEQELVVGGWTPGEGAARELGALVVGYYEQDGKARKLHFAGKVGSGFNSAIRKRLRDRLAPLATDDSPFDPPPPRDYKGRWGGELRNVVWVKPEIVIRAELGGWTRDGIVRQAAFKGFDEGGKPPTQVVRERPVEAKETVGAVEAALPESRQDDPVPSKPERRAGSRGDTAAGGARDAAAGSSGAGAEGGRSRRRSANPATASVRAGSGGGHRDRDDAAAGTHEFAWSATPDELAALDSMTKDGVWSVGGFELKLTNLDKPLFKPKAGDPEPDGSKPTNGALPAPVTKRELIRYFARIAPTMLPHLAERPLNLHRFPNGADGPGFWQKDIPETAPTWLRRWKEVGVEEREANEHLVGDRVAALCWLGNQAAFEVHAWTSRIEDPMTPTFALIDIDPGTKTTWDETVTLARLFGTALGHLGVRGYPKTTGKRGIQVWIPIEPKYTFRQTSDWVEQLSHAVGGTVPSLVSWEWAKASRGGKARLDYTQNTYIKTLVAPYSVRPADGAPVSTPITWEELDDPELRSDRWTIRTVVERVERLGDLFAKAQTDQQELPPL
ncbi:MAG TPA: non-homologous end-joining DNA ligase [Patescibacteria group bacterium]|nr:non-homologous end-joining DNA ligase [Patescibacteria group bacterium]